MSKLLDRRAILAGAATAAVFVQPGAVRIANAELVELLVGAGLAGGPDPIFAAIERYVVAYAEHDRACKGEPDHDSPELDAWEDASAIACHEEADAARA